MSRKQQHAAGFFFSSPKNYRKKRKVKLDLGLNREKRPLNLKQHGYMETGTQFWNVPERKMHNEAHQVRDNENTSHFGDLMTSLSTCDRILQETKTKKKSI